MITAYILLGTNLGDRTVNLKTAHHHISSQCGEVITTSHLYKTAAWGNVHQPEFYNQVILINTSLSAHELLQRLLSIEQTMGRVRLEKWGPRLIDLDILFYGSTHINSPELIVPHPAIPHRRFTLLPLVEIAPDFEHPVLKKNMQELLDSCTDTLSVEIVSL